MNTPLIVAHNASLFVGGAEQWTVRLLSALRARGFRVLLLCRDDSMAGQFRRQGVEARVAFLGGQLMIPNALALASELRRLRPEGLLLTTFKKIWLAGMGARLARVPRVIVRIGMSTDLPTRHWTYRVALRRWVDRTVVNADEIRRPFLAGLPDLDPARVITLYNGVETPDRIRSPGALRQELGIPAEAPVVGTLARLNVQKRLDRLLDVVARLGPDVHCIIAGDGDQRQRLVATAGSSSLAGRVHVIGHRTDVGDVLDAFDLFVLTSDREGMSNAMLEAMAAGVPVLSTPVSGASEALEPDPHGHRPGLLVPPDPAAIAGSIQELLAAPERRREMGRAGIRRARERFDFEEKVEKWATLLSGDPLSVEHEGPSGLRPRA